MEIEKKIIEEINNIITSCKAIRRLTNESTIPEEHIFSPRDGVIKNKLINTKIAMEIALKQLDHAYNINPLTDDHSLTMNMSSIRSEVHQLIEYYKALI